MNHIKLFTGLLVVIKLQNGGKSMVLDYLQKT